MMYSVERPFRLDQGDVSFDAPDSVKDGARPRHRTRTARTTSRRPAFRRCSSCSPRSCAAQERHPGRQPRRGDGHDPAASTASSPRARACSSRATRCSSPIRSGRRRAATSACAHAVPVPYPLHESRGWRPDVDEMRRLVTPKTRAIYVNSPNNPTGGVLTRADLEAIAALARERDLWVLSDEAYEDVLFDGHEHISIASLPGMYDAHDSALHVQQDVRDHGPAARLPRRARTRRSAIACARCSSTPSRTRRR